MTHIRIVFLLIALITAAVMPAKVAAKPWTIDQHHTTIHFEIKHIYSVVLGRFAEFQGDIWFDPDQLDQSRFDFTVPVKSINTFNSKRDTHLRSDDFFSADTFPEMTFTTTRITHQSGSTYLITGEMTIKDTRKTLEIPFEFHGVSPNPFKKSQEVAGFDTRFTLNRLDYGVGTGKFFKLGVVDEQVAVTISVEAIAEK